MYHLHNIFPIMFLVSLTSLPIIWSDLVADRLALLRLRTVVRGRAFLWNITSPNPCSWEGVRCNNITNRVIELRLPGDGLTGELPLTSIGNLTHLRALSLRGNSLSGPLPSDLGSCTELRSLQLQGNSFTGEIPETLFTLRNLVRLNLSRNNLSGTLPSSFNNLTKLSFLSLEYNHFTGSLPELDSLTDLGEFNVSFNELTGSIPTRLNVFSSESFLGTSLCGGPLVSCGGPLVSSDGDKLSAGAIAGIVVGSVFGFSLILAILFIQWRKYCNRAKNIHQQIERSSVPPSPVKPPENEIWSPMPIITVTEGHPLSNGFSSRKESKKVVTSRRSGNDGLVMFGGDVEMLSLQELLGASAEVLGKGTVGTTYKAYLKNGVEVIVKRLKNVCLSEKEFRAKMEDLGSCVHENLVPFSGYFYSRGEKMLIYEPMLKGSLSALLHGNNRRLLTWEIRSKIALGAASGIEYLHSVGPNMSHGNIKSSNILLTEYHDACISEFGLTQLVSSISPSSNPNGCRAPEVADTRKTSKKADVYSFGILLLELLTGKEADDDLPSLVQSVVEEKWTIEVFDPELIGYENFEEQMVQLLNLAISCTTQHPDRRPSMVEIVRRMKNIFA